MNGALSNYSLVREASSNNGTMGEILNPDGSHLCYTVERPWMNNASDQSCIPAGTYACVPHNSADHPGTWELQDVPGRSSILIHNGNTERDSLGCIIVGATQGTLNGLPAVLNSNVTLAMLQRTLPSNFMLTITGPDPS